MRRSAGGVKFGFIAVFTVALLLVGPRLASAQPVPSTQKSVGETAVIYVYRETSIIGIANFDVSFLHVDGRRVTRISMGSYIPITVSPGQHKLITTQSLFGSDTGKIRGQATVSVPAGATVYLRYSEGYNSFVPVVVPGFVAVLSSHYYRFERVPGPEAKSAMAGMSRLGR
jgi:hypothetical protein